MSFCRRTGRIAAALLCPAASLLVLTGAGCGWPPHGGARGTSLQPDVAVALLERQNQVLETLISDARKGPLVRFDQVLVVISQDLVQQMLSSATPYTCIVADKYRIRVDSASVLFQNGFAFVRTDGRASLAREPADRTFADVTLYSDLRVEDLDPKAGVLRARLNVIGFEARSVSVLGVPAPVQRLVEDFARERIEQFEDFGSHLQIPVRLEQAVTLPEVGPLGGVKIPRATIPLQVSVQQVRALGGRLWISLALGVGPDRDSIP